MDTVRVRKVNFEDLKELEDMLKKNDMLAFPNIDGLTAMKRVCEKMGRYFLVAEIKGNLVGIVRGCYDGSRALIHLLLVDKYYQRMGIGKKMLREIVLRFRADGAQSIAVTATKNSREYYKNVGFCELPVKLLVSFDITEVLEKTNSKNLS